MFGRSRERCCPAPSLQALVVWGHVSLLGGFWGQAAFGHLPEAPASGWSQGSKSRGSFQKKLVFFFLFLVKCFVSDRLLMSSTLIVIWGPQRKDAGYFESKGRRRFRGTLP